MQSLSDSRAGRVFFRFSGFANSLYSSAESPHRLQCLGPRPGSQTPLAVAKCGVLASFLAIRSGKSISDPRRLTWRTLGARRAQLATACCKTSLPGRVSHQLCSRKHRLP